MDGVVLLYELIILSLSWHDSLRSARRQVLIHWLSRLFTHRHLTGNRT